MSDLKDNEHKLAEALGEQAKWSKWGAAAAAISAAVIALQGIQPLFTTA